MITTDAQASLALTVTSVMKNLQGELSRGELASIEWLTTDNLESEESSAWEDLTLRGEDIALLQYTSGSTSTPKGTMVSHRNLLSASEYLKQACELTKDSISVTWLPSFHDMGLIDGIIQPLYTGYLGILMPPVSFLQRPIRWLETISRYSATHCGGPNFSYELCVAKVRPQQLESLDLSSWRNAYNGAEPIRRETIQRFTTTFGPCGFSAQFMYPCYGLAEATLMVSGGSVESEPVVCAVQSEALTKNRVVVESVDAPGVKYLVGSGHAWLNTKIVIANPESRTQVASDEIGEIWVSGDIVAQGYWEKPEATEQTFRAYLVDTDEGPFLRTGDLGFLREGELFVNGRIKDVIIIRGYNHYPQDIERTVEQSHPALRPECGAAFSVEIENEERLVVVQELERSFLRKPEFTEVFMAVRRAVAEQHGLQLYAISLLRTGSLSKTTSGKIQRYLSRKRFLDSTLDVITEWRQGASRHIPLSGSFQDNFDTRPPSARRPLTREVIQTWLIAMISERLRMDPSEIDPRNPFASYGLDSLNTVGLIGDMENWLGRRLSLTLAYDYPSIECLAAHLAESGFEQATSSAEVSRGVRGEPIAIVGMSCRFPGAGNPDEFWKLVLDGRDVITQVPGDRWDIDAYYDPELRPGMMNTRWCGFLEQVNQFDAGFFGISGGEAASMDPQQRLVLEVAWEALERGGLAPSSLGGSSTGVFIGASHSDYMCLLSGAPSRGGTGVSLSVLANRISYLLDLRGPSFVVDSACSSSLLAVHLACLSLRNRECDLALAGGVNMILRPEITVSFSQAGMMASDGRCKTFDASANGYVRGEGCGVLVLRRLSDCRSGRDQILATIRGSATNQDGRSNGLTAPNGLAQQAVIRAALRNAGVDSRRIGYVEAHGTGTPLGDAVEVESLRTVFGKRSPNDKPCLLGSVKTNIGHLEAAAGVAGLIKAVVSLQHETIPPVVHFKELNRNLDHGDFPFIIPKQPHPWPSGEESRYVGVSSFGFGGANVHLILEEAPRQGHTAEKSDMGRPVHIFTLSAKSDTAVCELAERYVGALAHAPDNTIADVCYTANAGRSHFPCRLSVLTSSVVQLRDGLAAFARGERVAGLHYSTIQRAYRPKVAFLFADNGSQYSEMGLQLYQTQPTFRSSLERCDKLLRRHLQLPLLSVLFPAKPSSAIDDAEYTQPALFSFGYALAEMLRSWGIEPDAVHGQGVGEVTAECVAGAIDVEDGLALVVERGRVMQRWPRSATTAAGMMEEREVAQAIVAHEGLTSVDAYGLGRTINSGAATATYSLQGDPVPDKYEVSGRRVPFHPPRVPIIAGSDGSLQQPGLVLDAHYWTHNVRNSVPLSSCVGTLNAKGYDVLFMLGPEHGPSRLYQALPDGRASIYACLKQGEDDWRVLLGAVAALYVAGVDIDWEGFDRDYSRRKLALPTYPFQRQRYWLLPEEMRNPER
jgi:acyl transferase domain-containing protein/acyl-CoA synthetase (AMP-forming)/AMP-acid ligase II/acyl carrier protein